MATFPTKFGALTSADIAALAPVQSVAGRTGAVVVVAGDLANFNASASAAAPVQSVAGRAGAVLLSAADIASGRLALTQMPAGAANTSLHGAGAGADPAYSALSNTLSTTPPAFDALTTVPTTVFGRVVRVSAAVVSAAVNLAYVAVLVEDAVGAGTYTEAGRIGAGVTLGINSTIVVVVPAGFRYKITKGGLVGVTETVSTYGFSDF